MRIDHREAELALRALGHLFEELAHTLRIRTDLRGVAARLLREEEVEIDGLLQGFQNVLCAGCDRIELALRQIEPCASQQESEQDRQSDE